MGLNPALIDIFCRCQLPVVSTTVVAVTPRSLSVATVTVANAIAPMAAVMLPEKNPSSGPGRSISQVVLVASTMPPGSSVIDSGNNKK
jgi:hypothetical protein